MLHVLLPAYNEAERLPGLLDRLAAALAGSAYRVLVLDDGSTDGTGALLARRAAAGAPLEVLRHERNLGLGATVRDLFREAARRAAPGDRLVRLDADGTQDPALIGELLARLEGPAGADVAVASRYAPGAEARGVPLGRRALSRLASLAFRLAFPAPGLRDYSSGFRAYRAELLRRAAERWPNGLVGLTDCGFAGTVEKLLRLRALGARFAEVPLRLDYQARRGTSRFRLWPTLRGCARLFVRGLNPWGELRRRPSPPGP